MLLLKKIKAEYTYVYCNIDGSIVGGYVGTAGSLIGIAESSNIGKCSSINAKIYGKFSLGGIVGQIKYYKDSINKDIRDCYFDGKIETIGIVETGEVYAGGIIGYMTGQSLNYIDSCCNNGTIIINNKIETNIYAGGIAGKIIQGTKVKNVFNNGNIITNNENTTCYVGGIIGGVIITSSKDDIILENSYNTGNIAGGYYQNGLIAYMTSSGPVNINNCYSVGIIEKEKIENDNVTLAHQQINGTRYKNTYILVNNEIYKWECLSQNANTFTKQDLTVEDLYSENFIKNVLGWDEDIWEITGTSYPVLKR